MHLKTEEPAASRMLEPFGEVGGDVPEYVPVNLSVNDVVLILIIC